jgi:hypothetical protein
MSQTLKERIEPLLHTDPDEARKIFCELAKEHDPAYDKGRDIGRTIISEFLIAGRRPARDPIFSLKELPNTRLDGFLSAFGDQVVLDTLQSSAPVMTSSCAVQLTEVKRTSELLPHELEFMAGRLPAVRIVFVPQEY